MALKRKSKAPKIDKIDKSNQKRRNEDDYVNLMTIQDAIENVENWDTKNN